ncbi:MAG: glutathione S-transferase C-terminal domain-containing protein [Solirubrobacteraceae bacterium]
MADPIVDGELTDGEFKRQDSRFREWVGGGRELFDTAPAGGLPVELGRYHLYVSLACPWCHRTVILRELAGLQQAVGVSYAAPFRDERGWAFTGERFTDGPGGKYTDALHGWELMSEAYRLSDPGFRGRITVPVLWDTETGTIVNNESSDIMRMMSRADSLGGLGRGGELELYPQPWRAEIDAINERVYDTVNNGVYRAGFARRQDAYERAFASLFDSFDWLEGLLGKRRYLLGERLTEADWRLFPTLVRFDEVYNLHFRCNRRRLVDYPSLWRYARELYQWPGVAPTVAMDQIKRHYYTTHDELNPKRIIPVGPGYDWSDRTGIDAP